MVAHLTVTPGNPSSLVCYIPGVWVFNQEKGHCFRKKEGKHQPMTCSKRGGGVTGEGKEEGGVEQWYRSAILRSGP